MNPNLATLHWQEQQSEGSNWQSFCICGDPNSIAQVYFYLLDTNQPYHLELSYNGRIVSPDGSNSLFSWYYGHINSMKCKQCQTEFLFENGRKLKYVEDGICYSCYSKSVRIQLP